MGDIHNYTFKIFHCIISFSMPGTKVIKNKLYFIKNNFKNRHNWILIKSNLKKNKNGIGLVQFSLSIISETLRPHGLKHARPPCPSPTPRAYSNSSPSHLWCHPTISLSVVPFSSYLQSFSASGSFPMSQFFVSGGQSVGVSALASVLPKNIQDWSPLEWTGWISLQSKGLSRVFSNTTV